MQAKSFIIRLFAYSLILLFIYSLIPLPAVAAGEFQTDYETVFTVTSSGTTNVSSKITLTNKKARLYPEEYIVTIDSVDIKSVNASDESGPIIPKVDQIQGKTLISVKFNQKKVGLGEKTVFHLVYENGEIAKKNGQIWEISIPEAPNDPDIDSYTVELNVPTTFGPNAYLTPSPNDTGKWTLDQLTHGGISAAYGKNQSFALDLTYFIEGKKGKETQEIALPPDTAFQKTTIAGIDPLPLGIKRDTDGNWLAQYSLKPGNKLTVKASLEVDIFLNSRTSFEQEAIDKDAYVSSTSYWQSNDPTITRLASIYQTPKDIYDFVVNKLSYDYEKALKKSTRGGAISALASPNKSICTDFTDLFVAIARAAGIPAREVVGYGFTTNSRLRPLSLVTDVLHAWPEYFDTSQEVWIPVDPTWADTTGGIDYFSKLDFNHIVLAIHGEFSDYPNPPSDIQVRFADDNENPLPQGKLITSIDFPSAILAGLGGRGKAVIKNPTGVSFDQTQIDVTSDPYLFSLSQDQVSIPPFSDLTIPITIGVDNVFAAAPGEIQLSVNNEISRGSYRVIPIYLTGGVVASGGFLLWMLASYIRHLTSWKKLKKH